MPPCRELEILDDAAAVAARAATLIAREVERARGAGLSLVLAGGTTPRAAYERLARAGLDWSGVAFYFGDERAVPAGHPDSNYRMAQETLFTPAGVAPGQVHRMAADGDDLEHAAREYERELPLHVDLLLLGVGEDAHTASLFPGSPAVLERDRRVLPVVGPKPPPRRLTIGAAVIEAARSTLVLATGAGKAAAMARALEGPLDPLALPIQLALGGHFLLDRGAAQKLGSGRSQEPERSKS